MWRKRRDYDDKLEEWEKLERRGPNDHSDVKNTMESVPRRTSAEE